MGPPQLNNHGVYESGVNIISFFEGKKFTVWNILVGKRVQAAASFSSGDALCSTTRVFGQQSEARVLFDGLGG